MGREFFVIGLVLGLLLFAAAKLAEGMSLFHQAHLF
jgi:hypothetical protein